MNRSNVGNIVTNAVQIQSISATTAAGYIRRFRDDASSALNAQAENERKENLYNAKMDKYQKQIENIDAGIKNKQARTEQIIKKTEQQEAKSELDRQRKQQVIDIANRKEEERQAKIQKAQQTVDDVMGDTKSSQYKNIKTKATNDFYYQLSRMEREENEFNDFNKAIRNISTKRPKIKGGTK